MAREKEVWHYMSIRISILKYQKNKALNITLFCIYCPPGGDSHKSLNKMKSLIRKNPKKPLF